MGTTFKLRLQKSEDIYQSVKEIALCNTKSASHKMECPHKVEKKLTPVPKNQLI